MNTSITPTMARNEVLREFAALTRHGPAELTGKFGLTMQSDAGQTTLHVSFGKRHADATFADETLEWSLDRFCAEIAGPLARRLFDSA